MSISANLKEAATLVDVSYQIGDLVRSAQGSSLVEYTRPTRVEPSVLMDSRCQQLHYIEDILATTLNIFTAYYLQAVNLSVNVGNINVLRTLDRLNPNRDPLDAATNSRWPSILSRESFEGGLPFPKMDAFTLESKFLQSAVEKKKNVDKALEDSAPGDVSVGIKSVTENTNLSIGKLIEVELRADEKNKVTIPVNVRLRTNVIRSDLMVHTLTLGSTKLGAKERWHSWRSGQIRFFKDVVLCQDLILKHKQNLIEDTSGYYQSRHQAKARNTLSSLLSGDISVATASSILIMTSDTAKELEMKMRGKLSKFRDREKLLDETFGMLLVIVNPDWEQVTVYHRSIDDATELSLREIQRSNRSGKGPDIGELLGAFLSNKAPATI